MICSLEDIRSKEVIDVQTGERLGYVDDVRMNIDTSAVVDLIIYGRDRLFGLLGREEDVVIPCEEIEVIGAEVMLIKRKKTSDRLCSIKNKRNFIESLFK